MIGLNDIDRYSQPALALDEHALVLKANPAAQKLLQRTLDDGNAILADWLGNIDAAGKVATQIREGKTGFIEQCTTLHNSSYGSCDLALLPSQDNNYILLLCLHQTGQRSEISHINDEIIRKTPLIDNLIKMAEKLAGIGYWRIDAISNDIYWSDEVYRIHGETRELFTPTLENSVAKYVDHDATTVAGYVEDAVKNKNGFEFQLRIKRRNGEMRWVRSKGFFEQDKHGATLAVAGILQDITDELNNKAKLERLSLVASKTTNSVLICDSLGRIEWGNNGFEKLTGYTLAEVERQKPGNFLHGPLTDKKTKDHISDALRECRSINCDIVNYKKNGQHYWINLVISPIIQNEKLEGFIGIQTDISDRKKSDSFVAQAQRMEAIGQLVGGVAHDFNNILGVLQGNLELLELKLSGETNKYLDKAFHACKRATDLTKKLLQFSQFKVTESKQVNANQVIYNLSELLTKSLTQNVKLELNLDAELYSTWTSAGDLEDTILNLVINARDAMEGNGKVVISTHNESLSNQLFFGEHNLTVQAGEYIRLSVKDTGPGISEDTVSRIFEPFFTTKGQQGSGLGLSMVYGFVQRSNGYILVNSNAEQGTELSIWLPRSDLKNTRTVKIDDRGSLAINRRYKILVVDDEPDIVDIVREYLTPMGCEIICTTSSLEAQRTLLSDKDIDLFITDEVMPGVVKGHSLVKTAYHANPKIRCIIMSGYNLDLAQIEGRADVLAKPFSRAQLVDLINKNFDII